MQTIGFRVCFSFNDLSSNNYNVPDLTAKLTSNLVVPKRNLPFRLLPTTRQTRLGERGEKGRGNTGRTMGCDNVSRVAHL